jgi:hypothetical protein
VEFSGSLRGERIIAPFGDANGAEAILGLLFLAEGYPESWAEDERSVFPTIQGLLAGVRDRLKEKVSRAKGPRRAWLVEAVSCAERAAAAFSAGRYADGAPVARECAEYIRGAGRTRHQTAPIILGPGNEHGSE